MPRRRPSTGCATRFAPTTSDRTVPTIFTHAVVPIAVSPIGARFFSARGVAVLWSELKWVWLPCGAMALPWAMVRERLAKRQARD